MKYETHKLKLTSQIAHEDHEIVEKRNVDIISSDEIARIREEALSLQHQIDSINHSIHCIKYSMHRLKSQGNVARDVRCLKHEVRLLKCSRSVPHDELGREMAELRSEVTSLKTVCDSDRSKIIHDVHRMKYEMNKLKLTSHIALEDHEILERRSADHVSSNEISVIGEESSSLHRQLDAMKHDIHCLKFEFARFKATFRDPLSSSAALPDLMRVVRGLAESSRDLSLKAQELSLATHGKSDLANQELRDLLDVHELHRLGLSADFDRLKHDFRRMKYEFRKVRSFIQTATGHKVDIDESSMDVISQCDLEGGAQIPEEISFLHGQFDVLKHSVHCLKYELKKLKLTSHIALEDHEILERRNVDIASAVELAQIREGVSSLHTEFDVLKHSIHCVKSEVRKSKSNLADLRVSCSTLSPPILTEFDKLRDALREVREVAQTAKDLALMSQEVSSTAKES
jgi:hypothetical protein